MRRIILLFTAAAMMAVVFAISAGPALADPPFDFDFVNFNDNDHFGGLGFDDQDLRSGDVDTDTDISVNGNNNNQCVGLSQVNNTGNFANQQGTSNLSGDEGDDGFVIRHGNDFIPFFGFGDNDNGQFEQEFRGPEVTFDGENETACDQEVQQAAAASSWGW